MSYYYGLPNDFQLSPRRVGTCKVACKAMAKKFSNRYVPTNEDYQLARLHGTSVNNIVRQRSLNAKNVCMFACYN